MKTFVCMNNFILEYKIMFKEKKPAFFLKNGVKQYMPSNQTY